MKSTKIHTLESFDITERAYVFATASLRNIVNSDEAAARITEETGFNIDIVTGEQEAILGYQGVMRELYISDGILIEDVYKRQALYSWICGEAATISLSYRHIC